MNWGGKIIVSFVIFIGLIFTLVYVSVNTEFFLVEDNYYEKELAYEDQIQRIKNHDLLTHKPEFTLDRKTFKAKLQFPEELSKALKEGEVMFYRASTSKYDKVVPLKLNAKGEFEADISNFPIGAWKLKLTWKDAQKEYYKEIDFVI